MAELDRFKANSLVVKRDQHTYGFYVNVNLPRDCLEDGTLDEKLERIKQVIGDEFEIEIPRLEVRYSITAAFLLTKANGEEKLWKGNFQPRGNIDNTLKPFSVYDSTSFNEEFRRATRDNYVRAALTRIGDDTEWSFFRVLSFIVNFQVICGVDHVFSQQLFDLNARSRLRRRRAVTHTRYFE